MWRRRRWTGRALGPGCGRTRRRTAAAGPGRAARSSAAARSKAGQFWWRDSCSMMLGRFCWICSSRSCLSPGSSASSRPWAKPSVDVVWGRGDDAVGQARHRAPIPGSLTTRSPAARGCRSASSCRQWRLPPRHRQTIRRSRRSGASLVGSDVDLHPPIREDFERTRCSCPPKHTRRLCDRTSGEESSTAAGQRFALVLLSGKRRTATTPD